MPKAIEKSRVQRKDTAKENFDSEVKAYHQRLETVKEKLPSKWRDSLFTAHPIYDDRYGYQLVNNVFRGQTRCYKILEYMEKIANSNIRSKAL